MPGCCSRDTLFNMYITPRPKKFAMRMSNRNPLPKGGFAAKTAPAGKPACQGSYCSNFHFKANTLMWDKLFYSFHSR